MTVGANRNFQRSVGDYKVYRAIVIQSGEDNPEPIVLDNSMEDPTITWQLTDTGVHTFQCAGCVPVLKTLLSVHGDTHLGTQKHTTIGGDDGATIRVKTYDENWQPVNNAGFHIELRVKQDS